MGFGEYVAALTFGIMATGFVALRPSDLPLLILGAVFFAVLMYRFIGIISIKVLRNKYWYFFISSFGGISASIGLFILFKGTNIYYITNGISWILLGIIFIKFNLDNIEWKLKQSAG